MLSSVICSEFCGDYAACVPRLRSGLSVSVVWKVRGVSISGLLVVVWVLNMLLR